MERPIIAIDEERCNGCGQCVLDCAEGALIVENGKARLISDSYCDGLGACLQCPQDALQLIVREAPAFDEEAALAAKTARTSTQQSKGCAGSRVQQFAPLTVTPPLLTLLSTAQDNAQTPARVTTWPLQLRLVPPQAPFLRGAHLLLAAHCAGFAVPSLHETWCQGRVTLIGCPKLDNDRGEYLDRLVAILQGHEDAPPLSLTVLRMSVPCCGALEHLAKTAVQKSGRNIEFSRHIVQL